ncbi:MAG TPA: biopolymer transporter ExbD [Pontiella sp.]
MRLSSGYEAKKARVEMLPLIDVVFLLLVFFIYAMVSMVVHHGLEIDLPAAETATMEIDDYISITIDADSRFYLNSELIPIEQLASRIQALCTEQTKPIFIDGDRQADLGLAIELLDELKRNGIEKVSFSCKPETP